LCFLVGEHNAVWLDKKPNGKLAVFKKNFGTFLHGRDSTGMYPAEESLEKVFLQDSLVEQKKGIEQPSKK